jgi:hypothetical protein
MLNGPGKSAQAQHAESVHKSTGAREVMFSGTRMKQR